MAEPVFPQPFVRRFRGRLSRADRYLADLLEGEGRPVISEPELFHFIDRLYAEPKDRKLYLRGTSATDHSYRTRKRNLLAARVLQVDRDYRSRFRVVSVPDRPADDIVCLADAFGHISHLSAMQRWGLTDRIPVALMLTRPDRRTMRARLDEMSGGSGDMPIPMEIVGHPEAVRLRPVQVFETRKAGSWVRDRAGFARVATIGQTFLDTLQQPAFCGGMAHVLELWQEHAGAYLDEIVEAVDGPASNIVKCRAGYILEDRLGVRDDRVRAWKAFAQRGGSRKLDPDRPFEPHYSETWMISLNVD